MVKYKTIKEFYEAIKAGEVSDECVLTLDNDGNSAFDPYVEEDGGCVYEDDLGYHIREPLLDLLGIPWEHV